MVVEKRRAVARAVRVRVGRWDLIVLVGGFWGEYGGWDGVSRDREGAAGKTLLI
jgi:hypothetical protein